uniref:Junctional adhesion molecule 2 n=1 Tax=Gopherus evgoodei TaxID=1825980 RepID=A0A8C4VKS2_9SAUR
TGFFFKAMLSCKYSAGKGIIPRVEWKKLTTRDVSFVYYKGDLVVASAAPSCEVPSSAMSGTVVQLSCKENEGSPASEYKWYRNGVALLENTGTGSAKRGNISYTMNKKTGTLLFNTVSKKDTGEYYCEASNGIGLPQKCSVKRMQVDDLNISGIIAAVVVVALVMALCGLGVFYAQKKGYFSSKSSQSQIAAEREFRQIQRV